MADDTAKFTLRFHNPKTHELLGVVAERMGMSKNQLAEQMLERELQAAALYLESDLLDTVALLRSYRRAEALDRDIEAVAEAEAYEEDPLRSHMEYRGELADAYGVAEAFSS
jgi:hypothetical protein